VADQLSLSNTALLELGVTPLTALTDATDAARAVLGVWDEALDTTLLLHPWSFARFLRTLTRSPLIPAWKYQWQYHLPDQPKFLHLVTTSAGKDGVVELGMDAHEGPVLWTDVRDLSIEYVGRVTDLEQWTPLARMALVKVLASMLAKALTGQTALAEAKLKEAMTLVQVGLQRDGTDHPRGIYGPEANTYQPNVGLVDIANAALDELGAGHIRSFQEDTTLAYQVRRHWPVVRDTVLRSHSWNFARILLGLTRSTTTPWFKWQYQYPLPDGKNYGMAPAYLQMILTSDGAYAAYEIGQSFPDNRVIFSNSPTLSIEYIGRILTFESWDPLALDIFIKRLAAAMAGGIEGKAALGPAKLKDAQELLAMAVQADAREDNPTGLFGEESLTLQAVDVANQALSLLGVEGIASLDDDTPRADEVRTHFRTCRDTVLELHPWNFAHGLCTLQLGTQTPPMEWAYQYLLPDGHRYNAQPYCLMVRECDGTPLHQFAIGMCRMDGRVLWTNEGVTTISYTGRIEDMGQWSAPAIDVLVRLLASRVARTLAPNQPHLGPQCLQEAYQLLPSARQRDGREGSPQVLIPPLRLRSGRYGATGPWLATRTFPG
jgi:hypothetical protein